MKLTTKKDQCINFRLSSTILDEVQSLADTSNFSKSEIARLALIFAMQYNSKGTSLVFRSEFKEFVKRQRMSHYF